jgi:XTP/dITP diphosphohydrolase
VFAATGIPALADDSGLCVEALGGAPGVQSARYAGEPQNTGANKVKLLSALRGTEDRRARFVAALALFDESGCRIFEGECHGSIAQAPAGTGGFGYDPVFIPEGHSQTFAELPAELKSRISHRSLALQKMVSSLSDA